MRDFVYDLRRTLTGKFTIVAIAIVIIVSALIGYGLTALVSSSSSSSTISVLDNSYYNNATGTYNVSLYAFSTSQGQAVGGLTIPVTVNGVHHNLTKDSAGFYNASYTSSASVLNFSYPLGIVTSSSGAVPVSIQQNPIYENNKNAPRYQMLEFTKSGTTNTHEILVFYEGNSSAPSPGISVYYHSYNISSTSVSIIPQSANMTFFSKVPAGFYVTTLYVNPSGFNSTTQRMVVEAFNTNGTGYNQGFVSGYAPQTILTSIFLAQLSFSIYGLVFGFLIPFLAALSAYFYFGKDRANGVLESVITRPVTKGRLILSRYIANVGSLMIGLVIGAVIFEAFLSRATGSFLPLNYSLSLIWVYLVEIGAFTGIVYVLSQFLKSQGAILGIGLGLTVLFTFLWDGLVTPLLLTYVIHAVSGTSTYQYYTVILEAINPSSYSTLVVSYMGTLANLSNVLDVTKYGITEATLAMIGLLWLLVPIVVAFVSGRKRD